MQIDLNTLDPEGEHFSGQDSLESLGLEGDEEVRVLEGVRYDVSAHLMDDDELAVHGRLDLKISLRCARCGEFYTAELSEKRFEWVGKPEDNGACADLTEDMRETMILRFPSFPLCAETCKGLCEQCGKDLNKEVCDCAAPAEFNR